MSEIKTGSSSLLRTFGLTVTKLPLESTALAEFNQFSNSSSGSPYSSIFPCCANAGNEETKGTEVKTGKFSGEVTLITNGLDSVRKPRQSIATILISL